MKKILLLLTIISGTNNWINASATKSNDGQLGIETTVEVCKNSIATLVRVCCVDIKNKKNTIQLDMDIYSKNTATNKISITRFGLFYSRLQKNVSEHFNNSCKYVLKEIVPTIPNSTNSQKISSIKAKIIGEKDQMFHELSKPN